MKLRPLKKDKIGQSAPCLLLLQWSTGQRDKEITKWVFFCSVLCLCITASNEPQTDLHWCPLPCPGGGGSSSSSDSSSSSSNTRMKKSQENEGTELKSGWDNVFLFSSSSLYQKLASYFKLPAIGRPRHGSKSKKVFNLKKKARKTREKKRNIHISIKLSGGMKSNFRFLSYWFSFYFFSFLFANIFQ